MRGWASRWISWRRPTGRGRCCAASQGVGEIFLLASRKGLRTAEPGATPPGTRAARARRRTHVAVRPRQSEGVRRCCCVPAGRRRTGVITRICRGSMRSHFCDRWLRFAYRNPPVLGGEDLPPPAADAFGELIVSGAQRAEVAAWSQARPWAGRQLILIQAGNKRTMRRGLRRRRSNSKYWPEQNWAAGAARSARAACRACNLCCSACRRSRKPQSAHPATGCRDRQCVRRGARAVNTEIARARRHAPPVWCRWIPDRRTWRRLWAAPWSPCSAGLSLIMYAPRGRSAVVECLVGEYEGRRSMLYITPQQVLAAWHGRCAPARTAR